MGHPCYTNPKNAVKDYQAPDYFSKNVIRKYRSFPPYVFLNSSVIMT
jgi:hypothetical protein